ncbi:unnamed protein product [Symbiodinium pilosum]|uniref:Uncharacterized protein n=1 Tax=Symbiodinium pilosum TaxID=2952 RepID=A0A812VH48_SYMPI|nr:unnamed protein product [Symbiodinium pilosum]
MVKVVKRPAAKPSRTKKSRNKVQTFSHVVPLGSTCLVAKHLDNCGLRVCKFPFDWMFSTPYLIRHALLDNFKTFLDASKYERGNEGGDEFKNGTIHKIYHRMQNSKGKKVIFPHHQLWPGAINAGRDRNSFSRSVARLRQVFRSKTTRTLFVVAINATKETHLTAMRDETWQPEGQGKCPVPEVGGPELCSRAEVLRLFDCLQQKVAGPFHLEVIYLLHGAKTRVRRHLALEKRVRDRSLRVSELACRGENTGLAFRRDSDKLAFHKLIACQRRIKPTSLDTRRTKGYHEAAADEGEKASSSKVGPKKASESSNKRKLRFVQENPKTPGSNAHKRYEAYKKARTVQEFLDLGGAKGDLNWDRASGFLTFL